MARWLIAAVCVLLLPASASALPVTLSGYLDDPGNPALVWSNLGGALFDNDFNIANNVAIYEVVISAAEAGNVTFESVGYAAGGIEPYFSLFAGSGLTATFLASNFFIPAIDFTLTQALAAGTYTVAIGSWENLSFAENFGAGTLADGFTGLGVPSLGSYYYEVRITAETTQPPGPDPIPEPATLTLVGAGLAGLARRRRARRDARVNPAA